MNLTWVGLSETEYQINATPIWKKKLVNSDLPSFDRRREERICEKSPPVPALGVGEVATRTVGADCDCWRRDVPLAVLSKIPAAVLLGEGNELKEKVLIS